MISRTMLVAVIVLLVTVAGGSIPAAMPVPRHQSLSVLPSDQHAVWLRWAGGPGDAGAEC
jgi:hypothetical protein